MSASPPAAGNRPPGVVLVQIDGLAHEQLQQALANGSMPFLNSLISDRDYRLRPFYSGLPSATPAVQGELFFGVRSAVPAFRFLSRQKGEDCLMFNPMQVKDVAKDLAERSPGLLRDGSSYSNIFIGGAANARYCIENLEPHNLLSRLHPLTTLGIFLQHCGKILRIIGLALIEVGLALVDMLKGVVQHQQLSKEIKFVPSRIWLCVVLRELVRFWVKRDIRAGVPIICANLVGYDEHAHRRGPSSAFAHWTLAGIDGVIRDIFHKARRAEDRSYRVVVYSDHGQEATLPYQVATGRSLLKGLEEAFAEGSLAGAEILWAEELPGQFQFLRRGRKIFGAQREGTSREDRAAKRILVTAQGPLGHVYLPEATDFAELAFYAERLVRAADIPLVFYRQANDELHAVNRAGVWSIPADAGQVLGPDHPCPGEAGEDLVRVARHADAGDLIISGWRIGGQPWTFPFENGAHGGPGSRECQGFLLLPEDLPPSSGSLWRPSRLRQVVREFLGRDGGP
ncbi:MAG TPA: hypothetical protein VJ910_03415 [Desulfuromonadales bacterium]|nr:hypothetical protein [Desulfuromonadales bacterium]